jgi:hypothetical protein
MSLVSRVRAYDTRHHVNDARKLVEPQRRKHIRAARPWISGVRTEMHKTIAGMVGNLGNPC